jgi:hypothetical protein
VAPGGPPEGQCKNEESVGGPLTTASVYGNRTHQITTSIILF